MQIFTDNKFTHHAWCVDGVCRDAGELDVLLGEYDIPDNLDRVVHRFENLLISDAHELRNVITRRSADPILHIIIIRRITRDSQNTLLKILEEPSKNTAVLMVIEHREHLLSTVESRLVYLGSVSSKYIPFMKPSEYLAMNFKQRFDATKLAADSKKPEPLSRADAHRFVDALEKTLAPKARALTNAVALFNSLQRARDYLGDSGSSVRMLLDSVGMNIPEKLDLKNLPARVQ
ncbi:MAG: hypothetical protein OEX08_02965 [Candidatus Nomurabacteria bacterium]|nr:hypothetical protein [Candidatus Nomurabacteria bacterium]